MKKIYLSLASIFMLGALTAQNSPKGGLTPAKLSPNSKITKTNQLNGSRTTGPFNAWIDPIQDIMTNKGLDLSNTASANQALFVDQVFQDSTIIGSFTSGNRFVSQILVGSVLDPKSSYLNSDLTPVVSRVDSYTIDSLAILGSYVKVTPSIDTLYIWLVWGDTSNTNVFSKQLTSNEWVSPISTWRKRVIGAKITGNDTMAGNKVKPSAPSTNQKLIKYVFAPSDSVSGGGFIKEIDVELDVPQVIPSGNIVSCFYTFVPGGTYAPGDCGYKLGGSATQNINGFAASVWGQQNPAVAALADLADQQVDPDGWNMGASYMNWERHDVSTNAYPNLGDLTSSAGLFYHIYGTSTVGVNEVKNTDFSVSQNYPNPSKGITSINYELPQTADVNFEVKDITGKLVLSVKKGKQSAGKYTFDFDTNTLESGVYFYTLKTENNQVTKKMSVIK